MHRRRRSGLSPPRGPSLRVGRESGRAANNRWESRWWALKNREPGPSVGAAAGRTFGNRHLRVLEDLVQPKRVFAAQVRWHRSGIPNLFPLGRGKLLEPAQQAVPLGEPGGLVLVLVLRATGRALRRHRARAPVVRVRRAASGRRRGARSHAPPRRRSAVPSRPGWPWCGRACNFSLAPRTDTAPPPASADHRGGRTKTVQPRDCQSSSGTHRRTRVRRGPGRTVLPDGMNMVRIRMEPCMPMATLAWATMRKDSMSPISSRRTSWAFWVGYRRLRASASSVACEPRRGAARRWRREASATPGPATRYN